MSEPIVISKTKPATKSLDYKLLVSEGLNYIRQWAGDSWTDHNAHDPGITLLETLCYALTDLGYRGQLDIDQLFDKRQPLESMALYPPDKALVCEAITAEDFQKLLITLSTVKYAQLQPADGRLNGLYDVQVEWENGREGNLNDSLVSDTILANGKSFAVEFAFPYWDEPSVLPWNTPVVLNTIAGVGQPVPLLIAFDEDELNDYFTRVSVTFSTTEKTEFIIVIRLADQPEPADRAALELAIASRLTQVVIDAPVGTYRKQVEKVFQRMNDVKKLLADHRNIGEDFVNFKSVRTQEIALRASIELSIDADAQQTLIDILSAIDLFIDPVIRFQGLPELLTEGMSIEDVFSGPLLSAGFLQTLSQPNQKFLYASDLLRLMLQNKAGQRNNSVIAVENFSMNSYIRNRLTTLNALNSLTLLTDQQFQPRLSVLKSEITFFRNGAEVSYDSQQVLIGVQEKRQQAFAASTIATLASPNNSTVSPSDWTPETVADYQSIQYDLPLTYGLRAGTPDSASPARKAQEKQLRGYLLLFEQILANHFSQLASTSAFFSFDTDSPDTYFYQPLYGTPQIDQLLRSYIPSPGGWEAFVADPDNPYRQRLQTIAESPLSKLQRKHRVLDHLLGRFGEELLEMSRLEYTISQQEATSMASLERIRLVTARRLLRYKAAFLRDLCVSESGRALGLPKQSSTGLSGLERRIYRKAGILQAQRRTLIRPLTDFFEIQNSGPDLETFRLKDTGGTVLLTSQENFSTVPIKTVFPGIRTAIQFGVEPGYYVVEQTGAAQWKVALTNDASMVLARSPITFASPADARAFIDTTSAFLYDTYSCEGLYLIEHILLRPTRLPDSQPDVYSFQITLVFPSGFERDFGIAGDPPKPSLPHRFRHKDFRNYVEAVIQQECAAHIVPSVFWLDTNTNPSTEPNPLSFNTIESLYQTWMGHFVADTLATRPGTTARTQLLKNLSSLRSTVD